MTTTPEPPPEDPDRRAWPSPGRRSNGLPAETLTTLLDLDPAVSEQVLAALGRAGVAATAERREDGRLDRVGVDARHRDTALGVVRDLLDDVAGDGPRPPVEDPADPGRDPFADARAGSAADPAVDVETAFRDLVARFDQGGPVRRPVGSVVDDPPDAPELSSVQPPPPAAPAPPPAAGPAAPRGRRRGPDDDDADSDGHYEPPDAPPVGAPSRTGQVALGLLGLGLVLMLLPGLVGFSSDETVFAAGVVSCAAAAALALVQLVRPLRADEGGEDGAVV